MYTALLVLEIILAISHFLVLAHIRLPKRKLLLGNQYYFVIDFSIPLLSMAVLGGPQSFKHFLYLSFHSAVHLFYVIGWDNNYHFKKIWAWSSLEWKDNIIDLECFPLTCYDISVHVFNALWLAEYLTK